MMYDTISSGRRSEPTLKNCAALIEGQSSRSTTVLKVGLCLPARCFGSVVVVVDNTKRIVVAAAAVGASVACSRRRHPAQRQTAAGHIEAPATSAASAPLSNQASRCNHGPFVGVEKPQGLSIGTNFWKSLKATVAVVVVAAVADYVVVVVVENRHDSEEEQMVQESAVEP